MRQKFTHAARTNDKDHPNSIPNNDIDTRATVRSSHCRFVGSVTLIPKQSAKKLKEHEGHKDQTQQKNEPAQKLEKIMVVDPGQMLPLTNLTKAAIERSRRQA